jgi:hypothetical protein
VITIRKTLINGTLVELRWKVEELACDLSPREYLAGTMLRELAVELATRGDLEVSVVTSEDKSQYLEVVLTDAPNRESFTITIDHSNIGDHCQITLDRWLSIKDQPSIGSAVNVIRALLTANARPGGPKSSGG